MRKIFTLVMVMFILGIFTTTVFAGSLKTEMNNVNWVRAEQGIQLNERDSEIPNVMDDVTEIIVSPIDAWFGWCQSKSGECEISFFINEVPARGNVCLIVNGERVSQITPTRTKSLRSSFKIVLHQEVQGGVIVSAPGEYSLELQVCERGKRECSSYKQTIFIPSIQVYLSSVCQNSLGDSVTLVFSVDPLFDLTLKEGDIVQVDIDGTFLGNIPIYFNKYGEVSFKLYINENTYYQYQEDNQLSLFTFYRKLKFLAEEEHYIYYWEPSPFCND